MRVWVCERPFSVECNLGQSVRKASSRTRVCVVVCGCAIWLCFSIPFPPTLHRARLQRVWKGAKQWQWKRRSKSGKSAGSARRLSSLGCTLRASFLDPEARSLPLVHRAALEPKEVYNKKHSHTHTRLSSTSTYGVAPRMQYCCCRCCYCVVVFEERPVSVRACVCVCLCLCEFRRKKG